MSDQELKPCPFCQQPLKVVDGDIVHPFSWCILSGVSFPVENATTWNTRTPDPILEELAGVLEKLSVLGNEPFLGNSIGNVIAQQALEKYRTSKVQP